MKLDQFRDPVNVALVEKQTSGAAAFSLACSNSGLEDREIYTALGIDPGYFSRMKTGAATLQTGQLREFCRIVGNTAYVEWMAQQVGCTLVMRETEAERRAEEAEQRAKAAEAENRLLRQLVQGRAVA